MTTPSLTRTGLLPTATRPERVPPTRREFSLGILNFLAASEASTNDYSSARWQSTVCAVKRVPANAPQHSAHFPIISPFLPSQRQN